MYIIAGIISVIFFIVKFLEMRYIDDEPKPLKLIIRDTLIIYVSSVCGFFIYDQLNPIINDIETPSVPLAFVDNPPF